MAPFYMAIMLNSQSLAVFFSKISLVVENSNSAKDRQQYPRCIFTKLQLKIPIFFGYVYNFLKSIHIFANFTMGMIGNEMVHLLECVKLYGKLRVSAGRR